MGGLGAAVRLRESCEELRMSSADERRQMLGCKAERVADGLIGWLPFYTSAKLAVLLVAIIARTFVSTLVLDLSALPALSSALAVHKLSPLAPHAAARAV